MAIVISKKKVQPPVTAPDPMLSEFAAKIDEVGRLEGPALKVKDRIKKLQEELKPYAKVQKELQEIIDQLGDPDAAIEELGVEFKIEAGIRGTSRKVTDMKRVHEILGDELFYACATITLKDLDAYMIEPQRKEVITESRSSRTMKITAR
ncbi:MAG: hypothetical protein M9945_14305 [Aquamicrobium sp.]|uniref:hypothetical protein n=1 Tax=Aquamicrobium sp. TaxID=1872579 RepID=UPI00349ECE08|nr:hypothetical protein [Aquamicrobium sp.]